MLIVDTWHTVAKHTHCVNQFTSQKESESSIQYNGSTNEQCPWIYFIHIVPNFLAADTATLLMNEFIQYSSECQLQF